MTEGRIGLANLWRQFIQWRVRWIWYLIAPGIVIAYHLVALGLNLTMGASIASPEQLDAWRLLALLWPLLFLGGQWEEPGWCGYALPRLQERFAHLAYGPLIARSTGRIDDDGRFIIRSHRR